MNNPAPSYHGYRFPTEIIAHPVWLCRRFSLSSRDVEDVLWHRLDLRPRGHPPPNVSGLGLVLDRKDIVQIAIERLQPEYDSAGWTLRGPAMEKRLWFIHQLPESDLAAITMLPCVSVRC